MFFFVLCQSFYVFGRLMSAIFFSCYIEVASGKFNDGHLFFMAVILCFSQTHECHFFSCYIEISSGTSKEEILVSLLAGT